MGLKEQFKKGMITRDQFRIEIQRRIELEPANQAYKRLAAWIERTKDRSISVDNG